jgi:DNA topoisomerase-1
MEKPSAISCSAADKTESRRDMAYQSSLTSIREKEREHLASRRLPREKVLATLVHLLETTSIRC